MKIEDKKLDSIIGGASTSVSGQLINAITNIIKVLLEAGRGVGEAIRRIGNDEICPLS